MAGTTHGLSEFLIYAVWRAMHARCSNPRHKYYYRYGGRGITVCARWFSPQNFLEDMKHPPLGMTIGRKNNDIGYCPENCRWETDAEQSDNTSRTQYIFWQGRTQTINGWSQELNLDPGTIWRRLDAGWDTERMLTTPTKLSFEEGRTRRMEKAKTYWVKNGRRYKRNSLARIHGDRPPATIRRRKGSRLTADVKASILELREQGLTGEEIARRVGVSRRSVVNVANGHR